MLIRGQSLRESKDWKHLIGWISRNEIDSKKEDVGNIIQTKGVSEGSSLSGAFTVLVLLQTRRVHDGNVWLADERSNKTRPIHLKC